jgi:U3 small nucleolar RNA-associated protein 23
MNLDESIPKVLQGSCKILVTNCILKELKSNTDTLSTYYQTRRCDVRKCEHEQAANGGECIRSMIGDTNEHRYIVITQDKKLRHDLREIPGVPLMYLNHGQVIFEPPSDSTMKRFSEITAKKLAPVEKEIISLKKQLGVEDHVMKRKRVLKLKEPNPLSCKKKKIEDEPKRVRGKRGGVKKREIE